MLLSRTKSLTRSSHTSFNRNIPILFRHSFTTNTGPLSQTLTAPNGRKYEQPTGLFINNKWTSSNKNTNLTSINPSDETEITSVHAAGPEDVDKAVAAARKAFNDSTWRDLPPSERGDLLFKLGQLVEQHKEVLATIETWDSGKPYVACRDEDMADVVGTLKYYAGWADKIHGQVIDSSASKLAYTVREPVGVCGQIIPWNFPLSMAAWKLGPALACGNTVVLKPAEQTPLSILYFANLIKEVGFPPGVVNIINGQGRIAGAAIAQHPDVHKIAFTGSTATGKEVMKQASGTMKNITLETGGKSPLLIFEDADLDQAVKWSHLGIMSNMGQVCSATSRILVHTSIYESFIAAFRAQVSKISIIGDPFADSTFQGPQISRAQHDRVLEYIRIGEAEGANLIRPDIFLSSSSSSAASEGLFIPPAIFRDVTPSMRIFREEVFGPLVAIAPFSTEAEAIALANESVYGLGAAVFTRDVARGHRVARRLEAGMVWINSSNDGDCRIPFGGVKQSGIGRELGEAGLRAYSVEKAVHVNLGT